MTSLKVFTLSLAFFFFATISFAATGRSLDVASQPAPNAKIPQSQTLSHENQEVVITKVNYEEETNSVHPLGILALILGVGSVFLFPVITELVTKKVISNSMTMS